MDSASHATHDSSFESPRRVLPTLSGALAPDQGTGTSRSSTSSTWGRGVFSKSLQVADLAQVVERLADKVEGNGINPGLDTTFCRFSIFIYGAFRSVAGAQFAGNMSQLVTGVTGDIVMKFRMGKSTLHQAMQSIHQLGSD